jgi:type I restriction enzyme R subunit
MLREFKKAFEMYHEKDIQGVLYNRDEIRAEFIAKLNELLELFVDIPKDEYDRKTLIKAVELLTTEEEKGKKFQEDYRTMRKLFQLMGPDLIKAEFFSTYKWLSAIYVYYTKTVIRSQPSYERYVKKYFDKTVKYVHKTTELEKLEKDLPTITFDQNYLKKIEQDLESKEEKAANIVFTLNRLGLVERHKNPVYIPLLKKVENILKLWKEKTKDFERIYKEGVETLDELQTLTKRQSDLGFSNLEYSLLLTLEDKFEPDKQLETDVIDLSALLKEHVFPGWIIQTTARKKVERELRRFVRRRYIKRYGAGLEELNDLTQKLIENVKNYDTSS